MILLQCKLNGSFLFSGLPNGFIKGKVFQIAFKTACLLFTHYVITPWCYRLLFASLFHRPVTQFSLAVLYILQYFGHLTWRADSLEKTLMLGKIDHKRRRGWQRISWLDSITDSMIMNLSTLWEIVKDREAWHTAVHRVAKSWTQLNNKNLAHLI